MASDERTAGRSGDVPADGQGGAEDGGAEALAEADDAVEELGRRILAAHEVTWALWAVLRTADEAGHAMARALGLTHTDSLALEYILTSPEPVGPVHLARRLGITSASVTVLVDRLVASGHLVRLPDPHDGRRRVLLATDRARDDALQAMTPLLEALDAVAMRLDEATATAVAAYLRETAAAQRDYTARRQAPPA
ncbi:MarR family winged helix-turn-helix transcriptional regulator [Sphaerisporangium sp. TRM90804]|uniref:MarR family winged helix-turn-helix transcriptional regulator n=1 Tax=Sphaerisporangium sp. TRM90804 TaxID=3031113 RepID=UPI0024468B59|nr:MarR family winged helix-turn-helix transcriptional regulator [Sphaerisporangium sp. TRM90804]MDH2429958.1 MarR family winged helix-turn-helix transcriptional regulator [Sphaerisporangium sp. TRM90804]